MKARYAHQKKEEKNNVQRKDPDHGECRKVQLLRNLRVWSLHLRLPEERVPLPGEQLSVWLPQICRRTLTGHGLVHRSVGEATQYLERMKYQ